MEWNTISIRTTYQKNQSRYHIFVEEYRNPVNMLCPDLTLDIKQSSYRINSEYISTEMIVYMGIRYMGREYVKSLADIYGMSISSV